MWQAIIAFITPAVARILQALGVGMVAYVGLSALVERLVAEAVASLSGLPGALAAWVGLLGIDQFLSIMLSALIARVAIAALSNIGLKKVA